MKHLREVALNNQGIDSTQFMRILNNELQLMSNMSIDCPYDFYSGANAEMQELLNIIGFHYAKGFGICHSEFAPIFCSEKKLFIRLIEKNSLNCDTEKFTIYRNDFGELLAKSKNGECIAEYFLLKK